MAKALGPNHILTVVLKCGISVLAMPLSRWLQFQHWHLLDNIENCPGMSNSQNWAIKMDCEGFYRFIERKRVMRQYESLGDKRI